MMHDMLRIQHILTTLRQKGGEGTYERERKKKGDKKLKLRAWLESCTRDGQSFQLKGNQATGNFQSMRISFLKTGVSQKRG